MAEDIKREQVDALGRKQGLSPNLVDAVRDILAGKKPAVTTDAPDDQVEEGNEYNVSVKGEGGVRVKAKTPKHAASKAFQKLGVAQRHRSTIQHTVKPHTEDTDVEEGKKLSSKEKMKRGLYNELDPVDQKAVKKKFVNRKDKDLDNDGDVDNTDKYLHKRRKAISKIVKEGGMSRLATQSSERERLGAKKVKGTGLDTFKKKPAKDTMIANPKTQKVRKVTPSRAKMAVKKGFVYAEHMDGLEEADAFKGQPTGVSVIMKHKDTGKKVSTKFPGTHSAVAGAKSHIAQMQKKGYAVHSKNLMYGKNEAYDTPAVKKPVSQMTPSEKKKNDERRTAYNTFQKSKRDKESVNELSVNKLSKYMSKSAASVSGKDAKTQDKRIAGQSMADKKIRKADGYSSAAKVGATNEARRGRPPKTGARKDDDMEASKHIVMQLRKSVSLRGMYKVEFKNGDTHKVSSAHAQQALNKHNSLRTPIEKKNYMDKLHHSHDSFKKALADKNPGQGPKKRGVSLAGPKFSR
jgi:hypothetical protein